MTPKAKFQRLHPAAVATMKRRLDAPHNMPAGTEPHWAETNQHLGTRATTHLPGRTRAPASEKVPVSGTGGTLTKEFRGEKIASSMAEASSLHAQREQDRLVEEFVKGLSGADREFAESVELGKPLADPEPHGARDEEEEGRGAEPVPEGERRGIHNGTSTMIAFSHPMMEETRVAIEELSEAEILEAHDAFGWAIAWAHKATHLVKIGHRLEVLFNYLRPDPVPSDPADLGLRQELAARFDLEERRLLWLVFGRVLAWYRDGASLSAMGLRGAIIAYVIRPTLLDAATNAQLGSPTNSTRQAVNKLVQEFRDTFSGIRAPAMRDEDTRHACRRAQFVAA